MSRSVDVAFPGRGIGDPFPLPEKSFDLLGPRGFETFEHVVRANQRKAGGATLTIYPLNPF